MPKESLPPSGNKEIELTKVELESFLKVKMDSEIIYNKNGLSRIEEGLNLRFVVTQDYNIYLVVGGVHNDIFNKLYRDGDDNFDRSKSLWPDGLCYFHRTNPDVRYEGELVGFQDTLGIGTKVPHLREAVLSKIKAFLNANSFNIK